MARLHAAALPVAVFLVAAVGLPRASGEPFGSAAVYAPSAFCGVPVLQFQSAEPVNAVNKWDGGQGNFGSATSVKRGAPLPLASADARGLVEAQRGPPPAQPAWLHRFLSAHATATAKTMIAKGGERHDLPAGHQMTELLYGTLLCSPLQPCPAEMPVMTTLGAVSYKGEEFDDILEEAENAHEDNEDAAGGAPYVPFASVLLGSVLPAHAAPAVNLRQILFPATHKKTELRAAWAAYEEKVSWLPVAQQDSGEDATDAERAQAAARSLDAFLVATQQMLLGLEHLEMHGIRHRDMKPDNVLLDGAVGSFVLADFGTMCAITAEAATASLPAHLIPLISGCKAEIVTLGCSPFPIGTEDFASPVTALLYKTVWYRTGAALPPGAALILGESLVNMLTKATSDDERRDAFRNPKSTASSDTFAVGLMLFHAISGQRLDTIFEQNIQPIDDGFWSQHVAAVHYLAAATTPAAAAARALKLVEAGLAQKRVSNRPIGGALSAAFPALDAASDRKGGKARCIPASVTGRRKGAAETQTFNSLASSGVSTWSGYASVPPTLAVTAAATLVRIKKVAKGKESYNKKVCQLDAAAHKDNVLDLDAVDDEPGPALVGAGVGARALSALMHVLADLLSTGARPSNGGKEAATIAEHIAAVDAARTALYAHAAKPPVIARLAKHLECVKACSAAVRAAKAAGAGGAQCAPGDTACEDLHAHTLRSGERLVDMLGVAPGGLTVAAGDAVCRRSLCTDDGQSWRKRADMLAAGKHAVAKADAVAPRAAAHAPPPPLRQRAPSLVAAPAELPAKVLKEKFGVTMLGGRAALAAVAGVAKSKQDNIKPFGTPTLAQRRTLIVSTSAAPDDTYERWSDNGNRERVRMPRLYLEWWSRSGDAPAVFKKMRPLLRVGEGVVKKTSWRTANKHFNLDKQAQLCSVIAESNEGLLKRKVADGCGLRNDAACFCFVLRQTETTTTASKVRVMRVLLPTEEGRSFAKHVAELVAEAPSHKLSIKKRKGSKN